MQPPSVSARIEAFHAALPQDKVRLKYGLMAENAYRFFRGTCYLFYEDLSNRPRFPHSSPKVWGCGDLHLENFGSYKASNRYVYFDQNDFDEAMLLPATWELVRVVTSILVAFKSLSVKEEKVTAWARLFLNTYCKTLRSGKAKHIEARLAKGIVRSFLDQAGRRKEKELLQKQMAKNKNSHSLVVDNEKRLALKPETKKSLLAHIADWLTNPADKTLRNCKIVDACQRMAGTGSVGVKRFLLLVGSEEAQHHFLLLDMKEARPSSLVPYNPLPQPQWPSEAERIVTIQSRSQYATTAHLSTVLFDGIAYTIQELQPEEDKLNFTIVVRHEKDVLRVIKDMALLTASAQLRSAGRQGSAIADELIAFGNEAEWQRRLIQYAIDYAAQVNKDYQSFLHDYQNGFFERKK